MRGDRKSLFDGCHIQTLVSLISSFRELPRPDYLTNANLLLYPDRGNDPPQRRCDRAGHNRRRCPAIRIEFRTMGSLKILGCCTSHCITYPFTAFPTRILPTLRRACTPVIRYVFLFYCPCPLSLRPANHQLLGVLILFSYFPEIVIFSWLH